MRIKKSFIYLLALLIVFIFAGCADFLTGEEPPSREELLAEEKAEEEANKPDPLREFFSDEVSDETAKENIFSALGEIAVDTEIIKDFEKIEDESGEEKYDFSYKGEEFTVILGEDSTVNAIENKASGAEVYLKGYEPYNAEDYIFYEYMEGHMKAYMDNVIELAFDYTQNYEYSPNWEFYREGDYYFVSNSVTVEGYKNPKFITITCYFDVPENTIYMNHVTIDGKVFSDFTNSYQRPERAPLSGK